MTDSQVEQTETTGYPGKETVTLPPDVAHAAGWVLDQKLGEAIQGTGVMLKNSQSSRLETKPELRDLIADVKSSHTKIRKTISGLMYSAQTQIRILNGRPYFAFSGKVFEQLSREGRIEITGETLELILDALQDTIGNNLSVLSGSSETVRKLSKIKSVRVDYEVIHIRAQELVEAFRPFANLSQIKIVCDKNGYRGYELIPNQERVLIG